MVHSHLAPLEFGLREAKYHIPLDYLVNAMLQSMWDPT